jgi:ATP-dependent Clp protease protease subunit
MGEIDDHTANIVTAQLLFLESEDKESDINLYINSPGGSVTAGLGIYDTMNYVAPDVKTIIVGQACSMGAFLASSGTPGKRFSLPNSQIMIHQPLGGFQGQASDIDIRANEIRRLKERLTAILAINTGREYSEVLAACDRDYFMTPQDALKFGMIDKILTKRGGNK